MRPGLHAFVDEQTHPPAENVDDFQGDMALFPLRPKLYLGRHSVFEAALPQKRKRKAARRLPQRPAVCSEAELLKVRFVQNTILNGGEDTANPVQNYSGLTCNEFMI